MYTINNVYVRMHESEYKETRPSLAGLAGMCAVGCRQSFIVSRFVFWCACVIGDITLINPNRIIKFFFFVCGKCVNLVQ